MTTQERAAARLRLMLEAGQARRRGADPERMAQLRKQSLEAKRARVARRMSISVPSLEGQKMNSAQAALNEILILEHLRAMRDFPHYKEFIWTHASNAEERTELGLRYQTRRFLKSSKRRHISIWQSVRKHALFTKGPLISPGGGQMYSSAIHSLSLTGVGK
jgi:phosphoribosyl-AMP cyclohydrolase